MPIKKVLCPVDCSESSMAALEYGLFVAKHFGGQPHLVHAWHVNAHIRPDLSVWMEAHGQQPISKVVEADARAETDRFVAKLPPAAREGLVVHVVEGEASRVITDMAARGGFDMIVMGTHGRSGLAHLALGSVAERVVRHSPCPVLTIPRPKKTGTATPA